MSTRRTLCSLAIAIALAAPAVHAAAVDRVSGEPARTTKAEAAPTWRLPNASAAGTSRMLLSELPVTRIADVQKRNSREGIATQIGIARDTASEAPAGLPALRWQDVAGGKVARIEVGSPDAPGMRLGLQLNGLPEGAELRFAGSDDLARVLLVSGAEARKLSSQDIYWTPMTDGEFQVIEIFAPKGMDTARIKPQVPQISHLLANSRELFSLGKAIGDSGACNVDTVCRVAALGQNFVNAKNAVARMTFVDGGSSYTCTGTLLNDTVAATQVPYFYSADHCISSQTVASTLNTFWGFEATTCNGLVAAANTQLTGGATLLYSDANTDALLLRLGNAPPAGAFFSGWNATQIADNADVLAIHHPAGDLKMSSLGKKVTQDAEMIHAGWTSGTTEGGSSGSGLFTLGSGGYELRGGLFGGSASCANSGNIATAANRDYYSRLDVVYPSIQQWLAPTTTSNGPTRNNGGLWYVPSEAGWGITAFQFSGGNNVLFVTWYAFNSAGQPVWYQLDGQWTGTDINSGPVRRYTGPAWSTSFNPAQVAFTNVGTATINFTSATAATLTYTVDGVTRTVTLSKIGS
ncbi:trypsin-like serine peptidase [Arenimonas sp. MALMAid1274]|uniref:trypsin-like serine peptidase n=1 Tax=Arenimonas sp. MALMAid1274 TaxID=3411630 RepID=UPI003BA02748